MGIKTIDFYNSYKQDIVLCLGFFDCLHIGHVALINKAKETAKALNAEVAMFTFDNNPSDILNRNDKLILIYSERLFRAEQLGVQNVISAHYDKEFKNMASEKFLRLLSENFNIKAIVAGSDYAFGYERKGDCNVLKEFFSARNIKVEIIDFIKVNGTKIASRDIRRYIKCGDIERVNKFLPIPYFIMGEVVHGRHVGVQLGYPTANINCPRDKEIIAPGVYCTKVLVDNTAYLGITNVGTHPTFDDYAVNIETYLLDYSQNLYGRVICVEFISKIRGIIKFGSKEELILQLKNDVETARKTSI